MKPLTEFLDSKEHSGSAKLAKQIREYYDTGSYQDKANLLPVILDIAGEYYDKYNGRDISCITRPATQELVVQSFREHGMPQKMDTYNILLKKKKSHLAEQARKRKVLRFKRKFAETTLVLVGKQAVGG